MEISLVMHFYPMIAGGGPKVIHEYANELVEDGHKITFYYCYYENKKLTRIPMPSTIRFLIQKFRVEHEKLKWIDLDKRIEKRLIKKINDESIKNSDIIIATTIETSKPIGLLDTSKGRKFYFIQDFENWNCSDEEVYASYNLRMTNIVVAKWLKEIVDKHSSTPSYLVSNCIDTNIFHDKGDKRRRHSIVFHYRSADYKGPWYAIETVRKLKEKYCDLMVDVISTEDKPEELPNFCTFHHALSPLEISEINNKTEVFMCASVEEGFGLPGLEAMACGCAVISSSYKGVLEYAVDGENALLSPVRDVDAMVANIVKLFEDDELRERIAENGIKTGKERSLEKSAKEFERILIEEVGK